MRLVLLHGWGFDASFWDALAPLLAAPSTTIDCEFFQANSCNYTPELNDILIGHSLGLLWGAQLSPHWRGWIAINSFAHFLHPETGGCVAPAVLRALRLKLEKAPEAALADFYRLISAVAPPAAALGRLNLPRLREGLDFLRDGNMSALQPAPGLVLAARHDPLVPASASQYLAAQAPTATLHWHETAGHLLPLQDPAWCASQINQWIGKHQ